MPRDKTGHYYFSWYPTIFGADTAHLSLMEDGAYHRLIDHYMVTRTPLPNNDAALARIIGVGREVWETIKPSIIPYFKPSTNPAGFLLHSFCDEVLAGDNVRITRARENGKRGGRPKKVKKPDNNPAGYESVTQQKAKQHNTKQDSDTDVSATVDFKKAIFDEGLRWLSSATRRGIPALRTVLGKWCRDYGDSSVAGALVQAQKASPVEAISYIEKFLRESQNAKPFGNTAGVTKTDRAKAAVARAAAAGGYAAERSEGKAGVGNDDISMFPDFETVR